MFNMNVSNIEYTIVREIGEGGFGTVYEAKDIGSNKAVAIKIIVDFPIDEKVRREFEILQKLSHPNIVELFSAEVLDNQVTLVMEFYPDGDLNNMMRNENKSEINIITFLKQMVDCLLYLKSEGVVHRDIKPANILVKRTYEGLIYKLTDFGLARLIDKSTVMTESGTFEYIAPEILAGKQAGFKADIYSLGVTVEKMIEWDIEGSTFWLLNLHPLMTKRDPIDRYNIENLAEHFNDRLDRYS